MADAMIEVVELFHKGKRVASHQRSPLKGRHSTVAAHMPKAHQHYAAWTPQRLILWAAHTGEATAQVVETILAARPHAQQGFRACLGIMRLGKRYGDDRLEAAYRRAILIGRSCPSSLRLIPTAWKPSKIPLDVQHRLNVNILEEALH